MIIPRPAMKLSNETPLFPLRKGKHARQAHVDLPEGTFEEEHARQGFFGKTTHLYRLHPPTDWTRIEGPLKPHSYDLNAVFPLDPAQEGDAGVQQLREEALRNSMFGSTEARMGRPPGHLNARSGGCSNASPARARSSTRCWRSLRCASASPSRSARNPQGRVPRRAAGNRAAPS